MHSIRVPVRRILATAVFAVGLLFNFSSQNIGLTSAAAQDKAKADAASPVTELVYGQDDAPVTIVEYASLTCPHCANFHETVFPEVKTKLIDTGKARMVYRHFPLDQMALRASVLVECSPGDRRTAMLDVLFSTQDTWARSQDPVAALARIGRAAGLTDEAIAACYSNKELIEGVINQRLDAEKKYQVQSTPSFVIDGQLYRGGMSAEKMVEVVDGLAK